MMKLLALPPVSEMDRVPRDEAAVEIARLAALQMALAGRLASAPAGSQPQTPDSSPRLVKAKELATLLSLRPDRVYELARTRRIPCVKTGKRAMRFDLEAVRKALAS